MPILRNPFRSKDTAQDENARPTSHSRPDPAAGFQKTEVVGAKPAKPASSPANESLEYQLSEIDDSGVYIAPEAPQKKRGWTPRTNTSSSNTSSHRSAVNENEPFNISRESFDSYRRSFDISARSPVIDADTARPRQSLDARSARLPPQLRRDSAMKFNPPETQLEDKFEDVGLDDAANKPKTRRGFFARFGDSGNDTSSTNGPTDRPTNTHMGSHFFNRKRAQSGQGAELGSMPIKTGTPAVSAKPTPTATSAKTAPNHTPAAAPVNGESGPVSKPTMIPETIEPNSAAPEIVKAVFAPTPEADTTSPPATERSITAVPPSALPAAPVQPEETVQTEGSNTNTKV